MEKANLISRRNFVSAMVCTAIGGTAVLRAESVSGPILWSLESSGGKVYIFGFADTKDRKWLSPKIESAFRSSKEVWFETPQKGGTPAHIGASQPAHIAPPEADQLDPGKPRNILDLLGPSLKTRTLATAGELGVQRKDLESVPAWRAYFVINNAFRTKYSIAPPGEVPDEVLASMAVSQGKIIHSESETGEDLAHFFATLPDAAQCEHLEDLLDYIADQKAGRNRDDHGWIDGHPDSRFIKRMHRKRPALYDVMHVQRNHTWADRISGFLSSGGVYFVCVGENHTLGPDSILSCLKRIGKEPRRV